MFEVLLEKLLRQTLGQYIDVTYFLIQIVLILRPFNLGYRQ